MPSCFPFEPCADVPALLARLAEGAGRPALTFYRGRTRVAGLTHGELAREVERVAGGLASGVLRGDRVAILSPNRLEVPVVVLALLRLGAVVVPLNPGSPPEDWSAILSHSGARGVVGPGDLLATVDAPVERWPVETLGGGVAPAAASDLGAELGVLLYTSGTTGRPKGVALTQRGVLWNAFAMARHFGLDRATQLAVLPLYHAHAFGFGLLTALQTLGHLVFSERFEPFTWTDVLRAESVEVTSVVPSLLPVLLQAKARRDAAPSLRFLLVSSAPLAAEVAVRFQEETGIPLAHGWGLSEIANFACCTAPGDERDLVLEPEVPSVGPALDGTDVAVMDESGRLLREGWRGELCVRSPSLMLGYYRDAEATRRTMRDGWLRTGDEGFWRTHRGRPVFTVTGRLKEIIIRHAEKLSPLALERALLAAVPELLGALVVLGFPHTVHGEEVGAYVEHPTLSADLATRLGRAIAAMPPETRPKVVLYGPAPIPRTHTGKVQRRRLQPLFAAYRACRGRLIVAAAS